MPIIVSGSVLLVLIMGCIIYKLRKRHKKKMQRSELMKENYFEQHNMKQRIISRLESEQKDFESDGRGSRLSKSHKKVVL
jgi:hypothetical protein